MLTYSYYKMYKYITILEKRINCMEENDSTRTIYKKEDNAESTTRTMRNIETNTEGTFAEGTFAEGTFGGGGDGGGSGGGGGSGYRGYKIMLITMINNCNDDDINTLINLYIQIISMIKNIYTKFSELYMQKN